MRRPSVVAFIPRVPQATDQRPTGLPLAELLGQHEANRLPEVRDSTRSSYRQTYAMALAALGPHPSVGEVGLWVTWLRGQFKPPPGFSDSWTVHLHWHNLAAIFQWGQRWGFVAGCNPAACLKLKKPTPRARAVVDINDRWTAFLGACHDVRERAFLETLRATAGRRGEVLGLMPADLVTTCTPWRLRFERQRPKPNAWTTTPLKMNGANRALPVTPDLAELLAEVVALGAPKVWTGKGGRELVASPFLFPYRIHELNDLLGRLRKVAPDAFPRGDAWHVFRHTTSVELDRSGATTEEIQKQLGHASPQTTREVYVNLHARPVDAGPVARMMAARAAGVTAWGAPPGGAGPPSVAPQKRTAAVGAAAVQERSKVGQLSEREPPCVTPKKQRALPGLAVGPVVVKKPRRRP